MFDGPIHSPTFLAYVEHVSVPTLHRGDVVVLDNFAVHKQPEAHERSLRSLAKKF